MSLNAATIEYLLSKGLTGDDLLEVARRAEMRSDPTAAKRMAEYRQRKRETRYVTRNDEPQKKSPQTPKEKPTPLNGSPKGEPIPPQPEPSIKPEHVVEAWNEMAERYGLPLVRRLTPERSRKLAGRLRTTSVDDWTEAISAIERSPFLRGENDRGWRADFDFLLQPASFTKLIEGSYDRSH